MNLNIGQDTRGKWGRRRNGTEQAEAVTVLTVRPSLTIERHPAMGSAGQHASVDVSGLGILSQFLSLSDHSFLISWLREYSVTLV